LIHPNAQATTAFNQQITHELSQASISAEIAASDISGRA